MTTNQMLRKLQYSKNGHTSTIAKRILLEKTTVAREREYAGTFLKYVLSGDYENALEVSTYYDREVLCQ